MMPKLFSGLSVGGKLSAAGVCSGVAIAALALTIIWQQTGELRHARGAVAVVKLTHAINEAIVDLQRERDLSAGFVSSKGGRFADWLPLQHQLTDESLDHLQDRFDELRAELPEATATMTLDGLGFLRRVREIRVEVSERQESAFFEYYSKGSQRLIEAVQRSSGFLGDPQLSSGLSAIIELLWLKERAGQERGVITNLFSAPTHDGELMRRAIVYAEIQQRHRRRFEILAPPELGLMLSKIDDYTASDRRWATAVLFTCSKTTCFVAARNTLVFLPKSSRRVASSLWNCANYGAVGTLKPSWRRSAIPLSAMPLPLTAW